LHEKLPHVFSTIDFTDIKSIIESWREIRLFIDAIATDNQIIKDGQVCLDGAREAIAENKYITISQNGMSVKVD